MWYREALKPIQHTGAMVALFLPRSVAQKVKLNKSNLAEDIKQIYEFILAKAIEIKNGTIDTVNFAGKLILALIVLPFYATYLITKKTYEDFGNRRSGFYWIQFV